NTEGQLIEHHESEVVKKPSCIEQKEYSNKISSSCFTFEKTDCRR
ncbi:hypothetical protein HMPREF1362_02464, partial [Enterococcus faecium ERV102]